MEKFIKGDVVIVPFPFSDMSDTKRRPALVVADLNGDDYILCQITTRDIKDRYSVAVNSSDFSTGSLKYSSNIRPNRLFTFDGNIIDYIAGHLRQEKVEEVVDKIVEILK